MEISTVYAEGGVFLSHIPGQIPAAASNCIQDVLYTDDLAMVVETQ